MLRSPRRRLLAGGLFLVALSAPARAVAGPEASSWAPLTLAVIGDTPYGAAQLEAFPSLVDAVNASDDLPRRRATLRSGTVVTRS